MTHKPHPIQRWVPLIILAIFLVPIVLACVYYNLGASPNGRTMNKGVLVYPWIKFSKLALSTPEGKALQVETVKHHWTMLYITTQACDKACEKHLYDLRQVRLSLGKNSSRVTRAIATTVPQNVKMLKPMIAKAYEGTALWQMPANTYASVVAHQIKHQSSNGFSLAQGGLFVLDLSGNLILAYSLDAPAKDIQQDLKRLLKVSQVG